MYRRVPQPAPCYATATVKVSSPPSSAAAGAAPSDPVAGVRPVAWVRATAAETPGALLRVAGLTPLTRNLRQLERLGYRPRIVRDEIYPLAEALSPQDRQVEVVAAGDRTAPERSPREHQEVEVAANIVRPTNEGVAGGIVVSDRASRRLAEDAVFAALLRGDLGFVARYLNKPLSFRITRYLLCRLPVTPNQVTLGAGLIGVLGAWLIASGRPWVMVAGFALAHLQSVLDGCDGELARVRFQQSPIGEWLDTIVDDVLNFLLLAAIGLGVSRHTGDARYLVAGLAGSALLLLYDAVTYTELVRLGQGGEVLKVRWWIGGGKDLKAVVAGRKHPATALIALGRRDFFLFAWLLLALPGWFEFILLYGLGVATACATVAVGQILWRLRR